MKEPVSNHKISFTLIFVFAVAMGFLEAIVVVYVRELYYPEGFEFPLKALPPRLVVIEMVRELCTLLMLLTVALITGKSFLQRLSVFLFLFGVWDIFYYAGLKLFLDWPESFFTWDILFLIPITWASPVLAPIICSVIMITMALLFENFRMNGKLKNLRFNELSLLFTGAFMILITFIYDFGMIILNGNYLSSFLTLHENSDFLKDLTTYKPAYYLWKIYTLGVTFIFISIFLITKRAIKTKKK